MDNNVNLNDVSRISAGTSFKGEIVTTGDIRIDGKFDGRLNSKGRLVVGESAVVNGDVICQNVDFSGKMDKGTFYVADTLSLKSGCSVAGDLRYKRLQVELDASISGTLRAMKENEFEKVAEKQPAKAEKNNETGKEE
ncbi:MAG: polymer-forming cytoskeletal protein [Bacteroidales bacterium]|nr:polymer-forming cytoskeletal protein [Bacteroidales bacterium]